MNVKTQERLNANPHYKDLPDGKDPEPEEDKDKIVSLPPKEHTEIPKHPTLPKKRFLKKKVDK